MADKKVALITGGASGIGLFTAKHLAAQGWHVSIADLNQEDGEAAAKEIDGIFTKTNVTSYKDMAKVFSNTWEKYGRIDFVFANAGILDVADFYLESETLPPPEPSLLTSRVNTDGAIYSAYLSMHYFRKNPVRGGDLIVTSSGSSLYSAAILPIYCASKYAVNGLVRSLGEELKNEGIKVNAILPSAVPTNIGLPPKLVRLGIQPTLPDDKITKPEHVLIAIQELLDDPTAFGETLEIRGTKRYRRKQPPYPDDTMAFLTGDKRL
ncbi:NAD(P)-binding protein [Lepidopterella palustris CBS 459.81]|uniref:NAD(P)-binding protein n=1 Tax=Lepidopterella palustris CBS 459.81 TaxID=1314670 RepID=A0A8E2JF18_9PEZI|nr:NAD(P)-binding protein [Lepidopterella palustris CBS 459.81]